jgi:hypothetical protein
MEFKNSDFTSKKTQPVSITKLANVVYPENHSKGVNTVCRKNAEFVNVKVGVEFG